MNSEVCQKIRDNPKFAELIKKRGTLAWSLAGIVFFTYTAFIIAVAFYSGILAKTIGGSVITVGILAGYMIIFLSFISAGVYAKKANEKYDELIESIKDDIL